MGKYPLHSDVNFLGKVIPLPENPLASRSLCGSHPNIPTLLGRKMGSARAREGFQLVMGVLQLIAGWFMKDPMKMDDEMGYPHGLESSICVHHCSSVTCSYHPGQVPSCAHNATRLLRGGAGSAVTFQLPL